MAKIFLDVGGYHGESSRAALDPRFGFDRVYCFEPVRACWEIIRRTVKSPRLVLLNAGLLDRTARLPVYQAGSLGGSVYADAPATGGGSEDCEFLDAAEFLRDHVARGDRVWMKLNCEGAECDVLLRLLASGEASKLTEVLLDLDARKIPSAAGKAARLLESLKVAPFTYHHPEEVQYTMVTNYGGIRNWLVVTGAIEPKPMAFVRSLVYQSLAALDPAINGYYKIRLLRLLRLRPRPAVPTTRGALVPRGSPPVGR
ncbi:MAG: FkbM family methyltransferase [Gammaproteobacteria bacterium]